MNQRNRAQQIGLAAEHTVAQALASLPAPWEVYTGVEWRTLQKNKEHIGEMDAVVFHPGLGAIILEVKAGAIKQKDGDWFYASGLKMTDPFKQARKSRYGLIDKLKLKLSDKEIANLCITHGVWFPDAVWKGGFVATEVPSPNFIFDSTDLNAPEKKLTALFNQINPEPCLWNPHQQKVLKEIFRPSRELLVPLNVDIARLEQTFIDATEQQTNVLRMLKLQNRLLIEGGAGTGKTLIALTLAHEHANQGKQVLLTCYNRSLADHIGRQISHPNVTVKTFHELTRHVTELSGKAFLPPQDSSQLKHFFQEICPELLMDASAKVELRFDSIIVDEAADFRDTWWLALESMGADGFSWYCFYDRQQSIYNNATSWTPPFEGQPFVLEENLRNTRPIGLKASELGQCKVPDGFRVPQGPEPKLLNYDSPQQLTQLLKQTVRQLIDQEHIAPRQITILTMRSIKREQALFDEALKEWPWTTQLTTWNHEIRVSTIHAFKGLESDVVILIDADDTHMAKEKLWYVGCSRAKAVLVILEKSR